MSKSNTTQSISVIMPAFNVELYIEESIMSVFQQNYESLELIVIDDGSTDATANIIQNYQPKYPNLKYLYQENSSPARARNVGLTQATGELIAFLDADDIWPQHILSTHSELLRSSPEAIGVMGLISRFHDQSKPFDKLEAKVFSSMYFCAQLGASLMHSKVLEKVGTFDESLINGEDTDWFVRIKESGLQIIRSESLSLYYRRRKGSLTEKNSEDTAILNVLKKSIDRRRHKQSLINN